MWKGAWIKRPMALHTAWGGTRKALRDQDGVCHPRGAWKGEMESPGPQATGQDGQVEAQIPHTGTGACPVGRKPSRSP